MGGLGQQVSPSAARRLPHPSHHSRQGAGCWGPEPGTLCRAVSPLQPPEGHWGPQLEPVAGAAVTVATPSPSFGPCVPSAGTGADVDTAEGRGVETGEAAAATAGEGRPSALPGTGQRLRAPGGGLARSGSRCPEALLPLTQRRPGELAEPPLFKGRGRSGTGWRGL